MASSLPDVEQDDILQWSDGFWCFREEFNAGFLRGEDYRVVLHRSELWMTLTCRNGMRVIPSQDASASGIAPPSPSMSAGAAT